MHYFVAGLVLVALAACEPAQYGAVNQMEFEGHRIVVMPMTNRVDVWHAYHVGEGFRLNPVDEYARNIRAIEAFTGCKADPSSASNTYGNSTVYVVCGAPR